VRRARAGACTGSAARESHSSCSRARSPA
jgi:hypothetical protein